MAVYRKLNIEKFYCCFSSQPSPHFSRNKINAILLNGQHAVTAITALWLWRSTAFRWLQQPIGRYLMSDVVEQVIQRHPEVKNEGIPEGDAHFTDKVDQPVHLVQIPPDRVTAEAGARPTARVATGGTGRGGSRGAPSAGLHRTAVING